MSIHGYKSYVAFGLGVAVLIALPLLGYPTEAAVSIGLALFGVGGMGLRHSQSTQVATIAEQVKRRLDESKDKPRGR